LEISETNHLFKTATNYAVLSWAFLVVLLYGITPPEDLVYLSDAERWSAAIAFFSLTTATLLLIFPFAFQRRMNRMGPLVWASVSVQVVAMITNGLLAFCPVMVKIDPFTRSPVYLIRWTEWIPMAGLMTFLCEGVAIHQTPTSQQPKKMGISSVLSLLLDPSGRGVQGATWASIGQVVSCLFGGLVCPFCTNPYLWGISMTISISTWATIFVRVVHKRNEFLSMRFSPPPYGAVNTYVQHEQYDRLKFSYHTMLTCAIVWTVLVVMYGINAFIHRVLPSDHVLRGWAPAMVADTFFDVLAKAFYMKCIVDVHFSVFDSEARSVRQLSELRSFMTVLWDTSSDVIVVSIKDEDGKLVSILSPSFLGLLGTTMPVKLQGRHATGLMVELTPTDEESDDDMAAVKITKAQYIDSTEAPYRGWVNHTVLETVDLDSFEAKMAATFITAGWERSKVLRSICDHETYLKPHTFDSPKGDVRNIEIKVSRHGPDAIIGVLRDVTERYVMRLFST
jgi:hypothetical protein